MYDEHNSYALINLANLAHNYEQIKARARGKRLILIVKADAYGHGALACARKLMECGGDYFAVANLDEAIQLREGGITAPILVLGYISAAQLPKAVKADISMACYSVSFAEAASRIAASQQKSAKLHIAVNTGMNRIGFSLSGLKKLCELLPSLSDIEVEGLFSHFSTADEADLSYSESQYDTFKKAHSLLGEYGVKPPLVHIQNSAATLTDFFRSDDITTAVRPGIILYGLAPSSVFCAESFSLRPLMTFCAHIGNISSLSVGSPVSYGRRYTASEAMRAAVVTAGYADGYFRALSNIASVYVHGKSAKILGSVCMDMMMIDITGIEGVNIGDSVELFGEHIAVDELAELAHTINYELCCAVAKRVARIYIE